MPGKLLPDERVLIEQHPVFGYDICRNLGFMQEELSIIPSHHEKWDGSGYPDGLIENDIPFFARIIALADVYEALTSERSYRKACTHLEAMKYLKENKRTHFDPRCVDAWEQLCLRNPIRLPIPFTGNQGIYNHTKTFSILKVNQSVYVIFELTGRVPVSFFNKYLNE